MRQRNGPERKAERLSLQFEQFATDGMHSYTIELFVDRGDERDDFDAWILAEKMQRPCAVFTTRPRERYSHGQMRLRITPRRERARWWRQCG